MAQTPDQKFRKIDALNQDQDWPQILVEVARQQESEVAARNRQSALEQYEEKMRFAYPQLKALAEQLKEGMAEGRWDSVVGDDISGHFPAIMVHHWLKKAARQHDRKVSAIMFVAPKRNAGEDKRGALKNYFSGRRKRLGDRTLVVTDTIDSGETISMILEALPRDLPADVASVSVREDFVKHGSASDIIANNFYHPPSEIGMSLHGLRIVTGREKDWHNATVKRRSDYDPLLSQAARQTVINMADQIYSDLFPKVPSLAA
jgi:hypoxanthine phosphoribosyltransferase